MDGLVTIEVDELNLSAQLTSLDLSGNSVGVEGAGLLASALLQNATLTDLSLANCDISEGCFSLTEALKENRFLTQLNLESNSLGDMSSAKILDSLSKNSALTSLSVGGNKFSSTSIMSLMGKAAGGTLYQLQVAIEQAHASLISATL